MFILLHILSNPFINRYKPFRMWCQDILEERWKFAVQMYFCNILFIPILLYAILNVKDYNIYNQSCIYSIILSWIAFMILISFYVIAFVRLVIFFKSYPKLSDSLIKATDIIQKDSSDKNTEQNIFMFDKKKIDLSDLQYPKINGANILAFKNIYVFDLLSLFCQCVFFFRGLLLIIIFIAAYNSPLIQIGLAMGINALVLFYIIRSRPYTFKYRGYRVRNYLAIFN
jgi:Ca2+/Na+ antiporter